MGEYSSKLITLFESNVSKLGLLRVKELLKRLGNPQNELKCVHVAGTNGKGSTCAYIESIMRCAGYKTALFSSPHIYDIREYIKISNEMISEENFEEYAKSAFEVCEQMVSDGFEHPTFFEMMTAIGFDYFNDSDTDIAIIEAGMGGKGDATNVIYPMLSVITPISLDHTDFLGNTISKIAQEKAGIIKADIPTVLSLNQLNVTHKIIKSKCKRSNSELIDASKYNVEVYDISLEHTCFSVKHEKNLYRFKIKNIGRHQAENAVTALCAVNVLSQSGYAIKYTDIKNGINSTFVDSRIQVYKEKKIIIDVSHNPDGVNELGAVIKELLPDKKIILLCSMLRTRDLKLMAREYRKFVTYTFLTESSHSLSASAEELESLFKSQSIECEHLAEIDEAAKKAEAKCTEEDAFLVVSGSFYMVSNVKKALKMI